LPSGADNQSVVQVRWATWRGTESGNSSGVAIDNISATGTAIATGTTTISAGAGAEPATISSLTNTQVAAALNFDIDIKDDGATPGTDMLATIMTQMVFMQGTGNDVGDWTTVIAGAELSDGTNMMTGTVNATNITFSSIGAALGTVADDATKTYTLKVWLKTDFGSEKLTADGKNLVFRIQQSNITVDGAGSAFASGQDQNSGASNNAIDVTATALAFVQNATTTARNASMSPAPTVSANDANGNRDLDYVTDISITSTGTLTGSPVSATPAAGLATFSALVHTVSQTGRQLTAASGALTSATSSSFDVIDVSLTTDYFRSLSSGSGTWSNVASWESSPDQIDWIPATLAPTSTSSGITIRNGYAMTVSSNTTVDQLVVESGGTLDITGGTFTVANGSGTDLTVGGVIRNSSSISRSTGAEILVSSTGKYQHNFTSTAGLIPPCTWGTGSTCEIVGYTSGGGLSTAGFNQSFHHFTWNCTNQTSEQNLSGTLTSIAGNLTVLSTGSSNMRLIGATTTTNVGGDLIVAAGATLNMSGSNSQGEISVIGNVNISGTLTETGGGSGLLTFEGTTNQTLSVSGSITQTVNVTINNGAGVTLNSDLTLPSTSTLTLTSGLLTLGNNNLTVSGSISGASSARYIVTSGTGKLIRSVGTSAVAFPVGNGSYNPATLTRTTASNSFGVRVIDAVYDGGTGGTPITADVVNRTWDVTDEGGSVGSLTVQVEWTSTDEGTGFDRSVCYLSHYTGGGWQQDAAGAASGSNPYTRSRSGITSLSPFGMGSTRAPSPSNSSPSPASPSRLPFVWTGPLPPSKTTTTWP